MMPNKLRPRLWRENNWWYCALKRWPLSAKNQPTLGIGYTPLCAYYNWGEQMAGFYGTDCGIMRSSKS